MYAVFIVRGVAFSIANMALDHCIKRLNLQSNEASVALYFKYQLLREYSKYSRKKKCLPFWLICVSQSQLLSPGTMWWTVAFWFCHGRTWGLCSPSGLWGFPWPAATYLHRTAGPSVTGQLTGKGRDGSCSYWARLTQEVYRAVRLLTILATPYQFLSSSSHLVGSLDMFCSFIFLF